MCKVKFCKLDENAIIPSYGRDGDGCLDVFPCSDEDIIIPSNEIRLIPTKICSTFPKEYRISLRERGSNTKSGLIVMAGQIDSNYTGEWFVAVYNTNPKPIVLTAKDSNTEYCSCYIKIPQTKAICQCAIEQIPNVEVEEIPYEEFKTIETNRGNGCLGSSGR